LGAEAGFKHDIFIGNGFAGEGDYIPDPRGLVMWETNFVPELAAAELVREHNPPAIRPAL
jgi:hypothetical protein